MPHALIVDDDPNACTLLAEVVRAEGLTIATAGTLQEARRQMAIRRPDIVLLDLNLPDGSGMELFQDVEAKSATEIVLITGYASVETSIEALRLGAADYLVKPIHAQQVKAILARLTRPVDLKADIDALRTEMRSLGKFGKLIGVSAPMQKVYDAIARVAPTPTTVL
nr:response regulator [Burkholderiales bacterium]